MREVSFVNRLKFNFNGSVTKKALVIGDADNDQHNELVCANLQGDLAIFKDRSPNRYAYASELGMVTACVIGDVINSGKNYVAAINTEGWLFIFDVDKVVAVDPRRSSQLLTDKSNEPQQQQITVSGIKLAALYEQRMPANCKELLLADLDGDGQNEVIVGLTDRVLRTYKWIRIGSGRGKFVGLYKWEFADQIGAVSLSPSSKHENCQDIIVAQPGGTYAKLECFDKKPTMLSNSSSSSLSEQKTSNEELKKQEDPTTNNDDNVRTEYISKLTPEYHQLALAQMRNPHISTEVLGGIRDGKNSESYSLIVIATLDGTLMLVNKDEILWSLQVDHQLFALAVLDSHKRGGDHYEYRTNLLLSSPSPNLSQSDSTCTIVANNEDLKNQRSIANEQQVPIHTTAKPVSQYFVVCAWNGKTYIIDEERNYLRFKFDEAVSAFTAGNYYFDDKEHASLVYATFNNQIILYYDVIIDHIRPMYLLNEVINNPENRELLRKLETLASRVGLGDDKHINNNIDHDTEENRLEGEQERRLDKIRNLMQDLLYNLTDEELGD